MKVLITGASGGIGKIFAQKLSNEGYDLVLVARSKEKLEELQRELKTKVEIEVSDLSIKENVIKLHEKYSGKIDMLINNAGYGDCGYFVETDLEKELNMIDLNVVTYHILSKLFLQDFVKENKGTILNVASSAAFFPGPLMATYYATKSYVFNLTMAMHEELRRKKSKVKVFVLCPGPVDTGFNKRANVKFSLKSLTSDEVVNYTLKCMKKNKTIIVPGTTIKLGLFGTRFLSKKLITRIAFNIQNKKISK